MQEIHFKQMSTMFRMMIIVFKSELTFQGTSLAYAVQYCVLVYFLSHTHARELDTRKTITRSLCLFIVYVLQRCTYKTIRHVVYTVACSYGICPMASQTLHMCRPIACFRDNSASFAVYQGQQQATCKPSHARFPVCCQGSLISRDSSVFGIDVSSVSRRNTLTSKYIYRNVYFKLMTNFFEKV